MSQLDGSLDGYEDCYVGRKYDFSLGTFNLNNIPIVYDDCGNYTDQETCNGDGNCNWDGTCVLDEKLDLVGCIEFSCENNELSLSWESSESCYGVNGVIDQAIQSLSDPNVSTTDDLLEKIEGNYSSYVTESGTSLNDIPDIEEYSDDFLFTIDNLPLPNIVNKFIDGRDSDIKLYDIFNSPDVAYDLDFSVRLNTHNLNFGYKQVGESFYSLANPYIQTNIRENYFTDRMRLLDNRLFLIFKYNNLISGFLSDNQSRTNKFDLNFSYYPGIELPSFNMNIGQYNRKSGEQDFGFWSDNNTTWIDDQNHPNYDAQLGGICVNDQNSEWTGNECVDGNGEPLTNADGTAVSIDECYNDITHPYTEGECYADDGIEGAYDNRIQTSTQNYNFSISHSIDFIYKHDLSFNYFNSKKKDKLFYERIIDENYVSPKSSNSNFNINVKTTYDYRWSSNFQYSSSNFDYGQSSSIYYQEQKINSFSGGFNYKTDALIDKVGATLSYSRGVGSNKYNQSGLKLSAKLAFRENLDLNLNYNYKMKKVTDYNNESPTQRYYNSSFRANLTYRF